MTTTLTTVDQSLRDAVARGGAPFIAWCEPNVCLRMCIPCPMPAIRCAPRTALITRSCVMGEPSGKVHRMNSAGCSLAVKSSTGATGARLVITEIHEDAGHLR